MTKQLTVCLVLMATIASARGEETSAFLSAERLKVEQRLASQTNAAIFAVNGMCCRNCSIGIGKMVCELPFVDTAVLPKGVKVDRKDSLLTVALKPGTAVDQESLVEAIRKAGYDPVRFYQQNQDGSLQMSEVPPEE
ncbi:MAG: heavy metal-associated domain-containing protein, partial [Verrucomicrobia bacterium]|nr:heavy metal-associated domain-containing protein [Verrucomicrobiota bacterium]